MNEKLEKTLSNTILTPKQAKIYLACLGLGEAKAPEIAIKADVKRTTVYGILDELIKIGFLSSSCKGKTRLFRPQKPQVLIERLSEQTTELQKALPILESYYMTSSIRPGLQFLEGRAGIKRIFEDVLESKNKKVCQVIKVREWVEFLGKDYTLNYMKERVKKNIVAFDIHPKSDDIYDENYGRESDIWKRRVKYLPPSIFQTSFVIIYDNKVAMASTEKENFGFIIESKEFSGTLRGWFELMWQLGSKDPDV